MKLNRICLKKLLVLTICVFFVFSLCSCNSSGRYQKRDIDQRIIVQALGVDITKDGKYEVTLQMLSQQGAGSNTPIDPSKSNSSTVSQIADTIPEAIEHCETDLGKKAFLGHSELILLGKSVDDISPIMDFAINDQGISLGTFVAYTDVTAKEILDIKIMSGAYSGEVLKEIFEESQKNGTSTECELIRHIDSIENTNGTTIMPIIKKIKDTEKALEEMESSSSDEDFGESKSNSKTKAGNEKLEGGSSEDSKSEGGSGGGESSGGGSQEAEVTAFYVDGALIIKNYKPQSVMTKEEVIGLSFLNDSIAEQTINAELNGMLTAVTASSVKKSTYVSVKNDRVAVDINLTVAYEFFLNYSEKDQKTAGEQVTKSIYSYCHKAIDKALKEANADIFEIHSLLNHNDYVLYEQYKKNPEEILKRVDINVSINPEI